MKYQGSHQIVITGLTRGCPVDSIQDSQWWQIGHCDNLTISGNKRYQCIIVRYNMVSLLSIFVILIKKMIMTQRNLIYNLSRSFLLFHILSINQW